MSFREAAMFSTMLIFAAALLSQPAAQTPPVGAAGQAPVQSEPQAAPERPQRAGRICERRAVTGRRLEQRVCYTPEQHAAMVEAKRREAEEIVGQANTQINSEIRGIIDPN